MTRSPLTRTTARERGTVLVIVLIFTMVMAMLALSAIALRSSDVVRTRSHAADRELRFSVDAALAIGKQQLTRDTTLLLPDTGFVRLMSNAIVADPDGAPLRGITVDVYAGVSASPTDRSRALVTLVARARDVRGHTRYVRRLDLVPESIASTVARANRWSDVVPRAARSHLAALHEHARRGHMDIVADGTTLTSARTRVEFVVIDVNDDGDATDAEEGFFRAFQAIDPSAAHANHAGKTRDDQCGDWHDVLPGAGVLLEFFPVSVHDDEWFVARGFADAGPTIDGSRRQRIMRGTGARCFPAGDPHLVAVERIGAAGYSLADWEKGGSDTTFTPIGNSGRWMQFPGQTPEILSSIPTVRQANEARYLWPLDPTLNSESRGVIHIHGPVLASGVLRGRVTVYSSGDIGFVDDLRYGGDPATPPCANLLGVIADGDAIVLDNGISSTRETPWIFNGLILSRTGTVRVRSWDGSESRLAGRDADRCMLTDSPPRFPTTGRFSEHRYYDVDPAQFDPAAFFQQMQDGL